MRIFARACDDDNSSFAFDSFEIFFIIKRLTTIFSAFFFRFRTICRIAIKRVFFDVDRLAVVKSNMFESSVCKTKLRRHSVVNSLRQEIRNFGIEIVLKKNSWSQNRLRARMTRDNAEADLRRDPAKYWAQNSVSSGIPASRKKAQCRIFARLRRRALNDQYRDLRRSHLRSKITFITRLYFEEDSYASKLGRHSTRTDCQNIELFMDLLFKEKKQFSKYLKKDKLILNSCEENDQLVVHLNFAEYGWAKRS